MSLSLPSETVFYEIESTIKEYRKFAQQNISNKLKDVTLDQGMVLLYLDKYPEWSQKDIAELVFKDNASMTRMIDSMVKKGLLKRSINQKDRRRFHLELTASGKATLDTLPSIIQRNRDMALSEISKEEITHLKTILHKIKNNIQSIK